MWKEGFLREATLARKYQTSMPGCYTMPIDLTEDSESIYNDLKDKLGEDEEGLAMLKEMLVHRDNIRSRESASIINHAADWDLSQESLAMAKGALAEVRNVFPVLK